MSEAEFQQEYMADFNVYEGQIWSFNHEECVADFPILKLETWTYSLDLM